MPDIEGTDYAELERRFLVDAGLPSPGMQAQADDPATRSTAHVARGEELLARATDTTAVLAALEEFRVARGLDPGSPLSLAPELFLTRGGDLVSALQALVDRWPNLGRPRYYLGWELLNQKRLPESVQQFQTAAQLVPEDPRVWMILARAAWAAGDRRVQKQAVAQFAELAGTKSALVSSAAILAAEAGDSALRRQLMRRMTPSDPGGAFRFLPLLAPVMRLRPASIRAIALSVIPILVLVLLIGLVAVPSALVLVDILTLVYLAGGLWMELALRVAKRPDRVRRVKAIRRIRAQSSMREQPA